MRARELWFTGPGHVEIRNRDLSEPVEGQVVLKTELCGISAGTEGLLWNGRFPEGLLMDEGIPALNRPFSYPCPYGYNLIGRIGGRESLYLAFHPHADAALVAENDLIELPAHWDPELAVLLPNTETAFNIVQDASPLLGERVAVFGLGVVGLLVTSMLSSFPLHELIAVDPDAGRRDRAGSLPGVNVLSPEDAAGAAGSDGLDLCVELSGSPNALQNAVDISGYGSRIIVGSWYGSKDVPLDLGSGFHRKRLKIISSQVSTIAPDLRGRWTADRRMSGAISWLNKHGRKDWVTHRFTFENAGDAYRLIEEGSGDLLQVVLEP